MTAHDGFPTMPPAFMAYTAGWILACLVAVALMIHRRSALELFHRDYWTRLFQGGKVITFAVAAAGMVVIAPYTRDPTWDYWDAGFMSILAYATAPWAVGICCLALQRRRPFAHLFIAFCVWMFTASWSYDLYLVLRDGRYPVTWLPNIFASSVLYLAAGLLWNLESVEGRGVIFGFMGPGWPKVSETGRFTRYRR